MVELLLAAALVALSMGMMTMVTANGPRALRTGSVRSSLKIRAARCIERMSRMLMVADLDSLAGFPASPGHDRTVTYDVIEDVSPADGSITWETRRLQHQYDPDDANDGLDNDGDGLIDEGRVVLIRDSGGADEQTVVLCSDVREYLEGESADGTDQNGNGLIDERGLCFELAAGRLTIRLTLEVLDAEGRHATRTVETTVHLRN